MTVSRGVCRRQLILDEPLLPHFHAVAGMELKGSTFEGEVLLSMLTEDACRGPTIHIWTHCDLYVHLLLSFSHRYVEYFKVIAKNKKIAHFILSYTFLLTNFLVHFTAGLPGLVPTARWAAQEPGAAPCQWSTLGGHSATSPGWSTSTGLPLS